jgi:hypothetical protein
MLRIDDAAPFAQKLTAATQRTVHDLAVGEIRHEEPFSDELCGRLKETLQDFETATLRWQVDLVTEEKGRARLSASSLSKYDEEKIFGADLVMVLDIETAEYNVKKGFLAQAKRIGPSQRLSENERQRLVAQCKKMLKFTQDAFVFVYSADAIRPLRANAVVAADGRNLSQLPTYDIDVVYQDFAICWVGDTNIQAADRASLEELRARVDAKAAIRIEGRSREVSRPAARRRPVKR